MRSRGRLPARERSSKVTKVFAMRLQWRADRCKRVAGIAVPVVVALCLAILLFWPALGHGRILAIGDGLIESVPAFFAPNERWQPAMLMGFPTYADPNKAYWYPLRLLRYVPSGFNVFIIAGYAIAAWATYGYVRSVTGVAVAGVASAVAFALGGFLIAHAGQPMIVQPAAWSCVALWSLDSYLRFNRGRWLATMALAEALCLASGQPQVAAFTVVLLLGYLLWIGCERRSSRVTLRVYLEGGAAIVLGVAAAAVAWLPAIAQGTVSVRSGLDFRSFVADSIPPEHLARMLVYPFAAGGGAQAIYGGAVVPAEVGAFTEATCYAGVGALALAALAPFAGRRRIAIFWIIVTCVALALAFGSALPFASWTFALPGFNLFRLPGRHAFEFTLGLSVLAGLGVSAIARKTDSRLVLVGVLIVIAVLGAVATRDVASQDARFVHEPAIAIFAAIFVAQFALLFAAAMMPRAPLFRATLACAAVVAGSWPFAATAYWRDAPPASILTKPAYVRLLERLPREPGQRVYTAGDDRTSELEPNLPTIWGVPEIGGYTPLQFANVHVMLQTGQDGRLLDVTAPMMDLAAVRYVAVPAQSESPLNATARFSPSDLGVFLSAGRLEAPREAIFGLARPRHADRIALITALGASVDVTQNRTVAILTVRSAAGVTQSLPLRAGVETAEFAYDRPDVLAVVRHRRAKLYERDGLNSWYECVVPLRLPGDIASVEFRMVDPHAALNVRKISLIDTTAARAYPFSNEAPYFADARRFKHIADIDGTAVFENLHSMPAVWIARAIPTSIDVTSDVALAALREGLRGIDYRRNAFTSATARVSTAPAAGSFSVIRDEPERRDVAVTCQNSCLVVSSATYTTDWAVKVDGSPARLIRADGVLQSVAVPRGRHVVRFQYRPSAGRSGIALSCVSIVAFIAWMFLRRPRLRQLR